MKLTNQKLIINTIKRKYLEWLHIRETNGTELITKEIYGTPEKGRGEKT